MHAALPSIALAAGGGATSVEGTVILHLRHCRVRPSPHAIHGHTAASSQAIRTLHGRSLLERAHDVRPLQALLLVDAVPQTQALTLVSLGALADFIDEIDTAR